ncbi:hypothetical protein Sjap_025177 [Stephania japonica]|uniref:Reverse transcriptase Ty1/copia-type domain-containing protein n=1 Tax=Stephania japonica TaxID=461633 RepID=A0AAP0HHQ7_9MAGN
MSETTTVQVECESERKDSSEAVPEYEENEPGEPEVPEPRRSSRTRNAPDWHSDYIMESNVAYCLLRGRRTINSSRGNAWLGSISVDGAAMQEEIEALHKNKTWELVPLPGGRKPIGNKWVYKIKRNKDDDQVERYRARLVVKGYAQKEGIDFNEIFSPVVRLTTVSSSSSDVCYF